MTAASGHLNQPLPPFQLKLLTSRPPPSSLAVSRRGFAGFEPFWAKVSGYATSSRQLMATSDESDGQRGRFGGWRMLDKRGQSSYMKGSLGCSQCLQCRGPWQRRIQAFVGLFGVQIRLVLWGAAGAQSHAVV